MGTGASIQDSYGKRPKGFKGGFANSNPARLDLAVAGAVVGVGTFVKNSATGVIDLTAVADVMAGVVLKSSAIELETIEANKSVTLARSGNIFVYSETACVKGADVFVRCIVGAGSEPVGNVRNDVDGVNAVLVKAKFAETLDSAGLVEIELNL